MQPLKFKEYLATGLPVVTRDLPATGPWSAAADMVTSSTEFASRTMQRARSGIPEEQTIARKLLAYETWQKKAEELAKMIGIPDGYVSNKALPV
jgi:sugar (pentulose or hexulose) kinase